MEKNNIEDLILNKYKDRKNYNNFKNVYDDHNRRLLLLLRKEYSKISKIDNYEKIQKELYGNLDRKEIINFEIARIMDVGGYSDDVQEQLLSINALLKLYKDEEFPDELYSRIIEYIIETEVLLGIRVGLFKEINDVVLKKTMKNNINSLNFK